MITKKQLAEKLQVTTMTINNLMNRGMPYIKIGKSVRYVWEDVFEWVKEQDSERINKDNN